MVCNIFKMLDENEIKILSMFDYKVMKKPEYVYRFEEEIRDMNASYHRYIAARDTCSDSSKVNKLFREFEVHKRNEFLFKFLFEEEVTSKWDFNRIAKYYDIIPFTPWVMINISPDWGDCEKRTNNCKIKILKNIIDSYMSEQWFEQWEYVIENGSQGNMIHAHIVAKMNTARLKSVESHLRRGNHTQQLKKYANKVKGMEGMIKGVSVQKVFVRTEEILKDKLDYLHEDKKPDGHKNLSVIVDGYVKGEL